MVLQVYVSTFGEESLLVMDTDEEVVECTLIRMGDVLRDIYDVAVAGPQQKKKKKTKQNKTKKNNKSVGTLGARQNDRDVVRSICTSGIKHLCHSPV